MSAPNYATRAEANLANAQLSTGPRTEVGKAAVSINATKHGLTSSLTRLDPRDSHAYQQNLADLTHGLAPANPTEELLIRDMAMLKARLDRIESAEYAILMSAIDGTDEAAAYLATAPQLASLEKTERFLRRNYMQTWSRLERMQRERKNEERDRKKQERELAETQPTEGAAEPAISNLPKQSHAAPTATKHEPIPSSTPAQPITANVPTGKTNANAA